MAAVTTIASSVERSRDGPSRRWRMNLCIMRSMHTKQYPVTRTDEEWRRILTPEQYDVLREHATERPGSCALLNEHRAGTFTCAGCGNRLFVADRKFESGTGWPSFFAPVEGAIESQVDSSWGMSRTEVHCS